MKYDELGPETVIRVHDPQSGMRGVLVIDNTVSGPAGGGTRMVSDLTEGEVAELARAMTYKWAIFGLPTGGAKAGIFGDPRMPAERKREVLRAFGRALAPHLRSRELGHLIGIGPDMGITGADTEDIYEGAATPNVCPTLYTWRIDGDPASFHMTGIGVVSAAGAALSSLGRSLEGATFAIEGFGQVGVGTARYAVRAGARVVAVTTLFGGLYDAEGLDISRLLELRRQYGDRCVLEYGAGQPLELEKLIAVDADVIVPGARPRAIDAYNAGQVRSADSSGVRVICPAGNLCLTEEAEERLHRRGVLCVPDFVANAGGIIATWADLLGSSAEQALEAVERLVSRTATSVIEEAKASGKSPGASARARVRDRLLELTPKRKRLSFDEVRAQAQRVLRISNAV
jgi:glutamate dehydrogenase (NAD(P)+)